MKMQTFAILDRRTGEYRPPMYFPHKVEAIRFFEGIANNAQSDLAKWPLDFQLNSIGSFDSATAQHLDSQPEEVCQIIDLIKKQPGQHNEADLVEPIRTIS